MANENFKKLLLPNSGYTAYLKKSITYGEHRALENIVKHGMIVEQNDNGVATPKISGEVLEQSAYKTMLAWISEIKDSDGNTMGSMPSVIDELSVSDGSLLEEEVAKLSEGVKKK